MAFFVRFLSDGPLFISPSVASNHTSCVGSFGAFLIASIALTSRSYSFSLIYFCALTYSSVDMISLSVSTRFVSASILFASASTRVCSTANLLFSFSVRTFSACTLSRSACCLFVSLSVRSCSSFTLVFSAC